MRSSRPNSSIPSPSSYPVAPFRVSETLPGAASSTSKNGNDNGAYAKEESIHYAYAKEESIHYAYAKEESIKNKEDITHTLKKKVQLFGLIRSPEGANSVSPR